jgi:SAM-dependent methyltransferase
MTFQNVYADARRADAYSTLQFPGTYYLAFRDLPAIIASHATSGAGLDFGCGAGRSTRFLRELGFATIGVDISAEMVRRAHELDPAGDYRVIADDGRVPLPEQSFDVILSAFTFDNIPGAKKIALFTDLRKLLSRGGCIVNLVSSPEIYLHEWASFSTCDFPENRVAKRGDIVRTVMKDVPDRRPVDDILWPDDAYREVYAAAGLEVVSTHYPLAQDGEHCAWINETRVAPWVIYVVRAA